MNNLKNIILLISLARIAWIDGKSKRITNKSLGTLLAVRLFFLFIEATEQTKSLKLLMTEVWFGFLIGGGLFFFCYCLGKQAMGAGDVKLMAVLGRNYFQKRQKYAEHAIFLSKLAEKAIDTKRNLRYNLRNTMEGVVICHAAESCA